MRGRAVQRDNPEYAIETVSKVFADVNKRKGPEWYNVEDWEMPVYDPDGIEISDWIGTGKYSDIFLAYSGVRTYALKVLKPVRELKYSREAKILFNLKGGPNIIKLEKIVRNPETGQLTFVFEYFESIDNMEMLTLTSRELKNYFYQLLKALHYAHSNGIIHRDIKPQNVLYNRRKGELKLIDWGLAEFYHPKSRYNIHVASRHYKPIELLVDYQCYDYSVDMWSFGATMAALVFRKLPFFSGSDDFEMVSKITHVLGTDAFGQYLSKYGIQLPPKMHSGIRRTKGKSWESYINSKNEDVATPDAIDLISKCMVYDHTQRITAEEAMKHRYFDEVRDKE